MPRYGPFIHQVYIADGFADDCDELIHRCLKEENLDYHVFCRIWKDMNMGCLYEGRTLGAEIAELSEEVIHVGKHYMLKDTSNFEESVVGVFIVYALLHLQPYKGFAHLRLVPADLQAINRIEHVARRDKRYDVLYALGSILIKGPVQYHAAEREYGMDHSIRKYLEGFTSIDKLGVRPKGVFRRQNEELDILKELDVITQKYSHTKMMISEKAQFDRNLKYIDSKFPKQVEIALMKLISGIYEEQYGFYGESSRDDGDKTMKSRQAIKEKAMKESVKPVRHLINIRNRKSSASSSLSPKKEQSKGSPKSKGRKVKKAFDARSERKRRIPISPRALKRNRKNIEKNRECKDFLDAILLDDGSDTNINDAFIKSDDDLESVASETIKAVAVETKKKEKVKKKVVKDEEENEQELDIEIDMLPVLIRTEEQGKLFEIEIIDNQKSAQPAVTPRIKTYKKKESALKKISSMPGMSIEKIVDTEVTEPVPSTSSAYQLATIVGIKDGSSKEEGQIDKTVQDNTGPSISGSKLEKRDCKRVHIQSKFKRLGMLPIANFKAPEDTVSEENNDKDADDEPQQTLGLPLIED